MVKLLRLTLLPNAVLYFYLMVAHNERYAGAMAGLFLIGFIVTVMRGIGEDIDVFERDLLVLLAATPLLATLPLVSSIQMNGVCTDHVRHYEIALWGVMYPGSAILASQLGKARAQALEHPYFMKNKQIRSILFVRPWMVALFVVIMLIPSAITLIEGLCLPGADWLFLPHAMSLPAFTIGIYLFLPALKARSNYLSWMYQGAPRPN